MTAPEQPTPPPGDAGERPTLRPIHQTVVVWVKADVDEGVAQMVRDLNGLRGVRTHSSCQGTIGEGGAEPYEAFVSVSWIDDTARAAIEARHRLTVEGEAFGIARAAEAGISPTPDIAPGDVGERARDLLRFVFPLMRRAKNINQLDAVESMICHEVDAALQSERTAAASHARKDTLLEVAEAMEALAEGQTTTAERSACISCAKVLRALATPQESKK